MKNNLISRIYYKGLNEQERQYLFPHLYGSKAITKRYVGEQRNNARKYLQGKYDPIYLFYPNTETEYIPNKRLYPLTKY